MSGRVECDKSPDDGHCRHSDIAGNEVCCWCADVELVDENRLDGEHGPFVPKAIVIEHPIIDRGRRFRRRNKVK